MFSQVSILGTQVIVAKRSAFFFSKFIINKQMITLKYVILIDHKNTKCMIRIGSRKVGYSEK